MLVPVLNIVLGAAMIVGGASGQLALFGTGSGTGDQVTVSASARRG